TKSKNQPIDLNNIPTQRIKGSENLVWYHGFIIDTTPKDSRSFIQKLKDNQSEILKIALIILGIIVFAWLYNLITAQQRYDNCYSKNLFYDLCCESDCKGESAGYYWVKNICEKQDCYKVTPTCSYDKSSSFANGCNYYLKDIYQSFQQ
ncbi:MAG: hypothetical protein WCO33_04970, partial [bacterium]